MSDTPMKDCTTCGLPEAIAALHGAVEKGFAQTGADLALVANGQRILESRVANIESRLAVVERQPSSTDLEHAAALSEEIVARKELAEKVDAVSGQNAALLKIAQKFEGAYDKLAANKYTKLIVLALAVAAYEYLSRKGLSLPRLEMLP